jgi:hypothetical protein
MRVFQNRVLRKIFGPRREEVTGEWRELHNEELNDLYFSPNIIHYQIKKKEMGGGSSTYEGDKRVLWGNLRERDHLEDLRVDGRITLEWILKMGGRGLHWSGSEQRKVAGPWFHKM